MVVSVDYQLPNRPEEPLCRLQLNTKFNTLYSASLLERVIHYFQMERLLRNALAIRDRSGVTIFCINYVDLHTATHQPLAARCYKLLQRYLKAIVNVQNQDNRCFGFAILSALHPGAHDPQKPCYYYRHFAEHGLDQLQYPVSPDQVPQLEEKLTLRINVFSFFNDDGKRRVQLFVSQRYLQKIDLLYFL